MVHSIVMVQQRAKRSSSLRSMETSAKISSPHDLKWLQELVTAEQNQVELWVSSSDLNSDAEVIGDVEFFIDNYVDDNLSPRHVKNSIRDLLVKDIAGPLEYALRQGVREIISQADDENDTESDDMMTHWRLQAVSFLLSKLLPRVYHHEDFQSIRRAISQLLTQTLEIIVELYSFVVTSLSSDKSNNLRKQSLFLRAKEFLSIVTLLIWSVCYLEEGIELLQQQTVPYLRQLAMVDLLDKDWMYANGWEDILSLLEKANEGSSKIPRIPADKQLRDTTEMIQMARRSIRYHGVVLSTSSSLLPSPPSLDNDTSKQDDIDDIVNNKSRPDIMFRYFPKCSTYMCAEIETPDKPHRLRCYKCHYYHWCSPACQEFSESARSIIFGQHHDLFCHTISDFQARQCRNQLEEYLGIAYSSGVADDDDDDEDLDLIKCHACGLSKRFRPTSMQRCSQCKAVHYCSRACQIWDWNNMDHKSKCKPTLL